MTFCSGGPRPADKGAGGGGVPGHPDPEIWGGLIESFFFGPSGSQFGIKIKGGASPPGPSLDPPLFWLLDQTLHH